MRELHAAGLNHSQIARETGISRATIRDWIRTERWNRQPAALVFRPEDLPRKEYAYLLAIYLGDGTISRGRKGVWKLRVFQDTRYPGIVGEIVRAMRAVLPNRVGVIR